MFDMVCVVSGEALLDGGLALLPGREVLDERGGVRVLLYKQIYIYIYIYIYISLYIYIYIYTHIL